MLRIAARTWCVVCLALMLPAVALAAPARASHRRHSHAHHVSRHHARRRSERMAFAATAAAHRRRVTRPRPAPVSTAPVPAAPASSAPAAAPAPAPTSSGSASGTPTTTPPPTGTTGGSSGAPAPTPVPAPVPVITGTTYYVSPSGSDSNSGTSPAQAWQTVARVNRASLAPGDGVLFQGGQTFSDTDLEPPASGASGLPIVFGSYGQGDAVISHGAWFVANHLTFDHLQFGATFYGGSEVHGPSNQITVQNCVISLPAGNQQLGLFANGTGWTIIDNTVQNTGLSGMLLWGQQYVVAGNTIRNVGLYNAGYNAHGIYLDAAHTAITDNTITGFSESAVSARYRNSNITHNYFSGGQIGIDFYQTDSGAGTSHWSDNTIVNTSVAGIYVSNDGVYALHESFVIQANTLTPSSGVYTNLKPTTGTYTLTNNIDTSPLG